MATDHVSRPPRRGSIAHVRAEGRRPRVRGVDIRAMLASREGCERLARASQFTLRLCVYLLRLPQSGQEDHRRRVAGLLLVVSLISTSRKLVALADVAEPAGRLVRGFGAAVAARRIDVGSSRKKAVFDDAIATFEALADDIECLGRLRLLVVGARGKERAARSADFLAMVSSALNLLKARAATIRLHGAIEQNRLARAGRRASTLAAEAEDVRAPLGIAGPPPGWPGNLEAWSKLAEGVRELEEEQWHDQLGADCRHAQQALTRLRWGKLCWTAEGIFATYDAFNIVPGSEGVRAFLGFMSAVISLWDIAIDSEDCTDR